MLPKPNSEPSEILALFEKRPTHIRPGLSRITQALALIGRPASRRPKVVVAGTNGKGTTSGMIWRLLAARGLKVGLFSSPHLVEFRERIALSDREVTNLQLVDHIIRLKKSLPPSLWDELTFFEINTILAFLVFDEAETDVNVLEVGLGGRLDCVNVYDPDVAVITTIGFDHMEYLGNTLAAIAREKSGIMRKGKPVVWGLASWADPEAEATIVQAAGESGARLVRANEPISSNLPVSIQRRPLFVRRNFELARVAVLEFVNAGHSSRAELPVTPKNIIETYDAPDAPWPPTFAGRFDLIRASRQDVDVRVLLDVCHNPHGARALADAITEMGIGAPSGKLNCLFSVLADKDVAGMWSELKGKIKEVIPFRSLAPRSWNQLPEEMVGPEVEAMSESFEVAWTKALAKDKWRGSEPWLICGSVAAIGEVLGYWRREGWKVERVRFDR